MPTKEYYQSHKKQQLNYQREYRMRPGVLERRRSYNKKYYSNPQNVKNRKKHDINYYWKPENRLRYIENHKKYRKTEHGKAVYLNCNHKRRFRIKNTDITNKWLEQLKQKTKYCPECGILMGNNGWIKYRKIRDLTSKSLDHIIPLNIGGTHTKNNIRIICFQCNSRRPWNGKK